MYKLYGGRFTRALIVQMVMAEGSIEYELHNVDILKNEHRGSKFLHLNPAGHIPVLVTPDEQVLTETHAINLYLTDHHNLTELVPGVEEFDRGLFLSSLFFLSNDFEPALHHYFYPHRYALRHEDESRVRELSLQRVHARMAVIETRLQRQGPYHLGERFSLADIILAFWVEYIDPDDLLTHCPALRHCKDLVSNRPVLRPFFDQLVEWRIEYGKLQAAGNGVK